MTERRALQFGSIFQLTMIGIYIAITRLYEWTESWSSVWLWPSHAGFVLFFYCLYVLYGRLAGIKKLITGGPFKYTRHPMYTGIFLMNLSFWLPRPASDELLFYTLQFLFLSCLIIAAWFQEKETLARFGREAEVYYAKTPRLALMYPFARKSM